MSAEAPQRPASARQHGHDLTSCATLMSCFDFNQRGFIDREDWRRGTKMLLLAEMGEDDALWGKLLTKYGGDVDDGITLDRLAHFVPMDPRVNLMMKAMVASVAGVNEKLERVQNRAKSQSETRANRVILYMRRQIMEPVLRAWAELVKKRLGSAKRALRYALNASLGKGFGTWAAFAEESVAAKRRLSKFAGRMLHTGLSRSWNQWVAVYLEMLRLRAFGRRMLQQGLLKAFNQWWSSADELAARKRAARKGLARLVHREIIGCWEHWSASTARQAEMKAKMKKLIRRWIHRAAVLGFNRWEEFWREQQQLALALQLAANSSVGRGFRRWDECVSEQHRLREVAERVMRRMLARVQAACFDSWYETVREAIDEREAKLRRAVVMMRMASAARCFAAWATECVGAEAQREQRMRRVAGRIRNRAAAICMRAWVEHYTSAKTLKAYYAARWANILLAKVYLAWAAAAKHEAELRERCRKIAMRIARRTEVLVLQEWHRWVSEARTYLRVALSRWLNDVLSAALETWCAYAAEHARFARLGRLVLGRYANSLLAKVLLSWANFVAEEAGRRQSATQQALAFLSGRQELLLRTRFDGWSRVVTAARREREQSKRGVIMRVRNRVLAMAFNAWLEMHVELGRAKRALRRWEMSAVARAVVTWATYAADRRRFEALARIVVSRFRDGLITRVFFHWSFAAKGERSRREDSTLKAMAIWTGKRDHVLKLHLRAWREWAIEALERKRELAGKVAGRYHNAAVAKCFMAWTVFLVHARKESGEKRLKALAFLSSKAEILLRFAFQALRRAIAAREDEREALVAKALMRIKYGTLHLAFSTWQELVAEAVKAKRIMGAVHPEVAAMRARLGDLEESVEGMAAELEAAPPWRGDELLTFDLAPMADALLGYGKVMGTVLECIKGLTEAVSETRLAVELGGGSWSSGIGVGVGAFVTASSTGGSAGPIGGEQFDAAELVRSRLQQLESTVFTQVDGAGQMLQQSERRLVESLQRTKGLRDASGRPTKTIEVPLHPLPIRSMDNLASATLKAELASTQQELAATRKELSDVVRSKAYRYELAYMRSELHSFLFRNSEDSPYPQDFVDAALQEADELQARSASSSRPLSPPPSGDEADGAPDADRQTQAPMPPRGTEANSAALGDGAGLAQDAWSAGRGAKHGNVGGGKWRWQRRCSCYSTSTTDGQRH